MVGSRGGLKLNNFKAQEEWSREASDEPFWDSVYRQAFPTMLWHQPTPPGNVAQRLGIDRSIMLSGGKILQIDEKKRTRDYPDVALEYISNSAKNSAGWIEKDLPLDYLAYAYMPSRRVLLFPWVALRTAWIVNRERWLKTYKCIEAPNKTYMTLSVCVPGAVLFDAICDASVITVFAEAA